MNPYPVFLPHLAKSRRISHPDAKLRLEQVGTKSFLNFHISVRAVMDLIEQHPH